MMRHCRMSGVIVILIVGFGLAQSAARPDRGTQPQIRQAASDLLTAQKSEDEVEVKRVAQRVIELLGDQAGVPEIADEFRSVPIDSKPLSPDEFATAFDPYLSLINRKRWWKVGFDPSKTNHALREVAAVIEGCLAARSAGANRGDELLQIAIEAGDFLVWAQEQAETGVFPFPAVRNGSGRPFEVAERFFRQAERDGKLDRVIRNGWAVEDFDDGGLQFDNGLSGIALLRLFEATQDEKYKQSAIRAADWALTRQVVPNWNYNSFSVLLLAEVYWVTRDRRFLEAAKKKARLGILPGQLTEGPHKGRWCDAHNARPAYHYILIRGLAALAAVLPQEDADLPIVVECLRLALNARNPDFEKGVINADSTVEALVRVKRLPSHVADKLSECQNDETLATLERYAATGFRTKKTALGPGAWGLLLKHAQQRQR